MSRPELDRLATEARHPGTLDLDQLATIDLVHLMNAEDARVPVAIAGEARRIAEAIELIAPRLRAGGRLVYIGAGTSGRLGVLDAAECPATFGTPPDQVVAIIAGGRAALTGAVEDAEDDHAAGGSAINGMAVGANDCVVGITASGSTPFVIGGLEAARRRGAVTISLAGTRPSAVEAIADVGIAVNVGPEVLAGSTRLKAGTAQKLVLNMISTAVMVRLGKTFGNLMVDVRPSNAKLRERAVRIVATVTGLDDAAAQRVLDQAGGNVKVAIVMGLANATPDEARERLDHAAGVVSDAIDATEAPDPGTD